MDVVNDRAQRGPDSKNEFQYNKGRETKPIPSLSS